MPNIKLVKFIVRVVITFVVMAFGMAIFWTSTDANVRMVGSNIVTGIFGTWMSSGSSSIAKSLKVDAKDPTYKKPTKPEPDDNLESKLESKLELDDNIEEIPLTDVKIDS